MTGEDKKVTTQVLQGMKDRGEKIAALTAYDYSIATILDRAGMDILLVGDSAANVIAGHATTLPITLDQMIYHASCVSKGTKRAFVVVDLPFGSYQGSPGKAIESAIRIMKETGANGVKLEGGEEIIDSIQLIVSSGIPVLGHLGLTPQSIHSFGSFDTRAQAVEEAKKLKDDCLLLQQAGCLGIVLEKIPAKLAKEVTKILRIPTIGIGAGSDCDGQVLVSYDMIGLSKGVNPKFLRRYANLYEQVLSAAEHYITDVKSVDFPNLEEQY